MKEVLFYSDGMGKGGLDKALVEMANALDKSRFKVTVMVRFPSGHFYDRLDKDVKLIYNMPFKCEVSEVYNHTVRVLCDRLPRKLIYKLFIKKKYDVEIACGDDFAATIIGGSTNKKSKKILWEHMDVTKDISTATYFSKDKIKKFFEPFDKIVGVSRECRDKFIEKYGFADRTSYVYNAINKEEIERLAKEFKVSEYKGDKINILSIGRFMPQKAFVRLIEVAHRLKEKTDKFRLFIIGDGPEREYVEKKIVEYNLEENVVLLGYKENPYPFIEQADLFVCASVHESYCLVVAESIILNTPVVSTRCTGPVELLENGKYGMLVSNDESGLYNGLLEMIENDNLRNKYKKKTIERKSFFEMEKCIKEWENIIES